MSEVEAKNGGDANAASLGKLAITDTKPLVELNPQPAFIQSRLELWDKLKKRADEELAAKTPQPIKIEVTDKEGVKRSVEGQSWKTTPYEIARQVGSKSWTESMVIAKVNGILWDLDRCLEDNCTLDLLKFDDKEGNYCLVV